MRKILTCQIRATKSPLFVENDFPMLDDNNRACTGESLNAVSSQRLIPPARGSVGVVMSIYSRVNVSTQERLTKPGLLVAN